MREWMLAGFLCSRVAAIAARLSCVGRRVQMCVWACACVREQAEGGLRVAWAVEKRFLPTPWLQCGVRVDLRGASLPAAVPVCSAQCTGFNAPPFSPSASFSLFSNFSSNVDLDVGFVHLPHLAIIRWIPESCLTRRPKPSEMEIQ